MSDFNVVDERYENGKYVFDIECSQYHVDEFKKLYGDNFEEVLSKNFEKVVTDVYEGIKNKSEFDKLIFMLDYFKIPYKIREYNWIDGVPTRQLFYPDDNHVVCDVIFHSGSYGFEEGLLEIRGLTHNNDSVEGFLKSGEVFVRLFDHYMENR